MTVSSEITVFSIISTASILAGFLASVLAIGRKLGWYQRRIQDMDKKLEGACKDLTSLDEKRQESEKASARYEEKLDGIVAILKEVKDLVFSHMINGTGKQ